MPPPSAGAVGAAAPPTPPAYPPGPVAVLADVSSDDAWVPDLVAAVIAGRRVLMVYDGEVSCQGA
jgi:hypothetical protein